MLSHQGGKKFAILTEEKSFLPEYVYEDFFATKFTDISNDIRLDMFEKHQMNALNLQAGSDTLKGIRYGGHSYDVSMPQGTGKFYERFWAFKNRFWHLAVVDLSKEGAHADLNFLMSAAVQTALKHTSIVKTSFSLIDEAYANEECVVRGLPDLNRVIPRLGQSNRDTRCQTMQGIAQGNRSNRYGMKILQANMRECVVNGITNAARSIRDGFAGMMNSLSEQTERELQRNRCTDPEPEIRRLLANADFARRAFYYVSVIPGMREHYSSCLQSAGLQAAGTLIWRSLVQTKDSAVALYNWVRTTDDPWSSVLAILATKANGFMCLTAQAQADYACEFAAIFVPTVIATVATGGGAGAARAAMMARNITNSLARMTGRMARPLPGIGGPPRPVRVTPAAPAAPRAPALRVAAQPRRPPPAAPASFRQFRPPPAAPAVVRTELPSPPVRQTLINRETVLSDGPEMRRLNDLSDDDRKREARTLLNDPDMSPDMQDCIIRAHNIGLAEGRGFGTFTQGDRVTKGLTLMRCGFSRAQTETLLDRGLAGSLPRPTFATASDGVFSARPDNFDLSSLNRRNQITILPDHPNAASTRALQDLPEGSTGTQVRVRVERTNPDGTKTSEELFGYFRGTDRNGEALYFENSSGITAINPNDPNLVVKSIDMPQSRVVDGELMGPGQNRFDSFRPIFETNPQRAIERNLGNTVEVRYRIDDGQPFTATGEVVRYQGRLQLRTRNNYNGSQYDYTPIDDMDVVAASRNFQRAEWSGAREHPRILSERFQEGTRVDVTYQRLRNTYSTDTEAVKIDGEFLGVITHNEGPAAAVRTSNGSIEYVPLNGQSAASFNAPGGRVEVFNSSGNVAR